MSVTSWKEVWASMTGGACTLSTKCHTTTNKTTDQLNLSYIWEFFVEKDMPCNLHAKVLCRLP